MTTATATRPAAAADPATWSHRAACRGHDTELWFPVQLDDPAGGELPPDHPALQICRTCPVRSLCQAHAAAEGIDWGIWGGLTPAERRRLRPARRATTPPASAATAGPRRRVDWTPAEDDELRRRWHAGDTLGAIAADLGRPPKSVTSRRRRLGLPPRDEYTRPVQWRGDPLLPELVRRLAAGGCSDQQIADQTGLRRGQVSYLRSREGITAGRPSGAAGHTTTGSPGPAVPASDAAAGLGAHADEEAPPSPGGATPHRKERSDGDQQLVRHGA